MAFRQIGVIALGALLVALPFRGVAAAPDSAMTPAAGAHARSGHMMMGHGKHHRRHHKAAGNSTGAPCRDARGRFTTCPGSSSH